MPKNIKKVQATFNINDPDQKAMYDYLRSFTNSSAKIKRMTLLAMQGKPMQQIPAEKITTEEEIPISSFALDIIL